MKESKLPTHTKELVASVLMNRYSKKADYRSVIITLLDPEDYKDILTFMLNTDKEKSKS